MIYIGLTGWGDHEDLYTHLTNKKDKLTTYSSVFPIVELDATYYAIQRTSTINKWCKETPEDFKFIVKAHQYMTGHSDYRSDYTSIKEVFKAFKDMLHPMAKQNKLGFVLLQFPPWFDCTSDNIRYVKFAKTMLEPYKVSVEFRNQTWFRSEYKEETLSFLYNNDIIHSICDEPQAGIGSIPFVNRVTDNTAFIRLHGRNIHVDLKLAPWEAAQELKWLKRQVEILKHKSKDIFIVFNNNSGRHAAGNAQNFIEMMDIKYTGLSPKQMKLF